MDKLTTLYVRSLNELEGALEPRKGQGLVEYVLILALISIVAITLMASVGTEVKNAFTKVVNAINTGD